MTTKKTESKSTAKPKAEKKATEVKKASKPASKIVTDDEIAQRAYQIHLETGNHDAHENWVEAEKQLKKKK
ncbi:MAG: hypothetical protein A2046_00965 [Bacteroidetes bacterium GWA2_30_7]|nr:MAG: hypothetical protein A2046_00965 [Bacteroidetes bacterium GWA2_30_7]